MNPGEALLALAPAIGGLIAGSILGAWLGASYATRISVARLDQWVLWLLASIGLILIAEGLLPWQVEGVPWGFAVRLPLALVCGLAIGLVSSLLGVAGGELLIPTFVLQGTSPSPAQISGGQFLVRRVHCSRSLHPMDSLGGEMNASVKTLVTSGVASSLVAGVVGWFAASHKIEQELHSRQAEAGYEALVKANTLFWQSSMMRKEAERGNDGALLTEAQKRQRESDASYIVAQHKIVVFGDERVVAALSNYYYSTSGANRPCDNRKKFKADIATYRALRDTLGVRGRVSDEQLSRILFQCSLK
ncbi:MAG TPA: sulfite exporter TauE/SafE family protein [Thermoanaerobaculia bacterium]|nr:sulfite exporter TauE/SafE family protein [Thermoanaerobaculia bacterium]